MHLDRIVGQIHTLFLLKPKPIHKRPFICTFAENQTEYQRLSKPFSHSPNPYIFPLNQPNPSSSSKILTPHPHSSTFTMPKTKNANYPATYEPIDQETDNDSPPHALTVPLTRGRSHAASSSQLQPVDISDQFDTPFAIFTAAEGDRFDKLRDRDFTDAKIMCRITLVGLGIEEEVHRYLNIWGLQGIEDSPHDSYKEITYELLTTLRKRDDGLKFRLHGIEYVVNQELLRNVFLHGSRWCLLSTERF